MEPTRFNSYLIQESTDWLVCCMSRRIIGCRYIRCRWIFDRCWARRLAGSCSEQGQPALSQRCLGPVGGASVQLPASLQPQLRRLRMDTDGWYVIGASFFYFEPLENFYGLYLFLEFSKLHLKARKVKIQGKPITDGIRIVPAVGFKPLALDFFPDSCW